MHDWIEFIRFLATPSIKKCLLKYSHSNMTIEKPCRSKTAQIPYDNKFFLFFNLDTFAFHRSISEYIETRSVRMNCLVVLTQNVYHNFYEFMQTIFYKTNSTTILVFAYH